MRRKLDDLSPSDQLIIVSICALADQLENDVQEYLPVISWVREYYFGTPGRSRGEVTKGYIETRESRVRKRWT